MEGDQAAGHVQPGKDISIHTLRMEGDGEKFEIWEANLEISIHTLRMEGDTRPLVPLESDFNFNPHPPHGG